MKTRTARVHEPRTHLSEEGGKGKPRGWERQVSGLIRSNLQKDGPTGRGTLSWGKKGREESLRCHSINEESRARCGKKRGILASTERAGRRRMGRQLGRKKKCIKKGEKGKGVTHGKPMIKQKMRGAVGGRSLFFKNRSPYRGQW